MTVCEVRRNDALKRVLAVVKGGKDPGDGVHNDGQRRSQRKVRWTKAGWKCAGSAARGIDSTKPSRLAIT
jgi:hypothetical protein